MGGHDNCCVYNCSHWRGRKGNVCSFFVFPKDRRSKLLWIIATGRADISLKDITENFKVCGCHFQSGKPNRKDSKSIDAVPSVDLPKSRKTVKARRTSNSISSATWAEAVESGTRKAIVVGNCVPDVGQEVVFPLVQNSDVTFEVPLDTCEEEEEIQGSDHSYAKRQCFRTSMTEDSSCQTEFSRDKEAAADSDKEKAELILRLEKSQKHIELLEQRIALSQPKFCAQDILNESSVQFWTGLPSVAVFNALFTYLEPKAKHLNITGRGTGKYQSARKLDLIDEFFAVLVRLKVGLFVRDISQRLCISEGFFSKIFDVWIRFLRKELEAITRFPSVEEVRPHLPACFSDYPDTRVVIDCTEVYVQKPSSLKSQRELWSNYKHHNTYKGLVGISPDGTLSYVSDLYGGSASDKFITKDCGILELLQEGDNVMADRGFDISDLLVGKGVTLNIPPFINRNETQLSAQQVEETRRIASVRIHVERAIQRIKTFHILDGVVPLSLHSLISDIFKVCAYLTNFQTPIL